MGIIRLKTGSKLKVIYRAERLIKTGLPGSDIGLNIGLNQT